MVFGDHLLREYAGAVSAVLSQPELPPREESPLSATSEGRTDDEKVSKLFCLFKKRQFSSVHYSRKHTITSYRDKDFKLI